MSRIEGRGLHRGYGRGEARQEVLEGLDLEIAAGSMVALLGPSGSGKSTLLNLIAGLDRPDAGEIWVGGERVDRLSGAKLAAWRARAVGFVFQRFHLVPVLSAAENVELPLHLSSGSNSERRARVELALDLVAMGEHAHKRPGQLSGGQEQRVAIARAIVADPDLVVADEPTGALDTQASEGVVNLLQRLAAELGKTVLIVTHDHAVAEATQRILTLGEGRIVSDRILDPAAAVAAGEGQSA